MVVQPNARVRADDQKTRHTKAGDLENPLAHTVPIGIDQDWEPGTMPGWRKTASAFCVGGVLLSIAAVTLFGIIGTMSPGGGGNDEEPDPTCYPSLRC